MYILGIGCYYHDSSATLVKDGVVVAAAEEERFTRKKHDTSFPSNAIRFCMESEGISGSDLAYVAFYEKPLVKFERVLSQHVQFFPYSLKTFLSSMPSWLGEKLRVQGKIRKVVGFSGDILFVEHHLAHAGASFFPSPFKRAAVFTVDGVGEWTTTAYGFCEGSRIRLDKEIRFPHSLGLLYSSITAYLGFTVNNSEYKVMGLAPYGDMSRKSNRFYPKLLKLVDVKDDGSFHFDMSFFKYHFADRMPSEKLCRLLGGPVREAEGEVSQRHRDIAAALQLVTEDILTKILKHVHRVYKCDDLVVSGGVALNSVYNGKILSSTPFRRVWINPSPGDGGSSMGAALYVYNGVLKKRRHHLKNAFLGPGFTRSEVKAFLDSNGIKYSTFKSERDLVKTTAKLIRDENVIGWFQGRMEWGPRALGARSILADPTNPKAKELLNTKVKHREKFRPFAPVVCEDDAKRFFKCDSPVPEPTDYMLMVYPIKKKWHKKIPSVTHVDGSGRLQTIRRSQNRLYYDVVKEFGRLSKVPILINTSFNIRGEPIVCTPEDAYRCMMGTGIDFLVIDCFLVARADNAGDMWDSESLAFD